jgi:hypothetical protein
VARAIASDPDARAGGLALVHDLRKSLGLPRADFDRALVGLVRDGTVVPHLVDSPGQWTDAERAQFLAIPVAEAHAMGLHATEGAAYEGKTYYFQSVAVQDPAALREESASAPGGPASPSATSPPPAKGPAPAARGGGGFPADDAPRKFDEGGALAFEKSQRPFLDTVTGPERDAVRAYTSSLYDEVNGPLRAGTPLSGRAAEVAGHLDAVFARAPKLAEPVTCYRGIALGPADAALFQRKMAAAAASGAPVTMPGFSSTSLDPGQAGRFGGKDDGAETFFEVRARHGLAVQPLTSYRTEHEFLLPRSAQFRVHGLKDVEVVNAYGESRRVKVIQVEQL